jgi:L-ascorbate metabolism protein UlaG (beta-lactamase superfamily)
MKFTYYGHSCFSVVAGGKKILFDPFISPNELAKDIDIDTIEADYIFISHGHFDHVFDLERIAKRTGAMVLGNWELVSWFNKLGIKNNHPINPGGQFTFDFGTVKCVIAIHSSSLPDGTYAGSPGGYVFKTIDGNFYYSGDSGLTLDMKLIPEWAKIDFAVFPVGDGLTMGVTDAIRAADFVDTSKVIGVHYDTFGYIILDHQKAKEEFVKSGKTLQLMDIGSTIEI